MVETYFLKAEFAALVEQGMFQGMVEHCPRSLLVMTKDNLSEAWFQIQLLWEGPFVFLFLPFWKARLCETGMPIILQHSGDYKAPPPHLGGLCLEAAWLVMALRV